MRNFVSQTRRRLLIYMPYIAPYNVKKVKTVENMDTLILTLQTVKVWVVRHKVIRSSHYSAG